MGALRRPFFFAAGAVVFLRDNVVFFYCIFPGFVYDVNCYFMATCEC